MKKEPPKNGIHPQGVPGKEHGSGAAKRCKRELADHDILPRNLHGIRNCAPFPQQLRIVLQQQTFSEGLCLQESEKLGFDSLVLESTANLFRGHVATKATRPRRGTKLRRLQDKNKPNPSK